MRFAAIVAGAILVLAAGGASAQVCTTSTTVVSRGPDVISSTTSTRCEAAAQPAAAAPEPALPCTQTTTVVRRLDVVVSSSTQIKCEEPGASSGGITVPKGVLAAPASAASLFDKMLGSGPGETLTTSTARGDWHVLDPRARAICQLLLTSASSAQGFGLRKTNCGGAVANAVSWAIDGGAVVFRARDGAELVRLTGTRERMSGKSADGKTIELGR